MLVLSRRNGQKIIINDNIEITILESKFDSCKIAINAPREVTIYREEIYKQIQFSNRMSNKSSVDSINAITNISNEATEEVKEKVNKIIIKKK